MLLIWIFIVAAAAFSLQGLGPRHVSYPVLLCLGTPEGQYFSCQSPLKVANNSCCYENYGIIMQTQFWDFDQSYLNSSGTLQKPHKNTHGNVDRVFTIHGLWDDLCDGSYKQYCNPSLEFADSDNISDIIANDFGRPDLLRAMQTYWINTEASNVQGGASEALWTHEFNKHGTCFNTLQPTCFMQNYTRLENAIAYFQKTFEVWTALPTYKFLKRAGILPTTRRTYNLKDVQRALAKGHGGKQVYVGCTNGSISEIWYYHNVRGNVLTGQYIATDSLTTSNCPLSVRYLPK